MANVLDSVKTIILVMMENRSFDHMLGHLTLDDPTLPVEGLRNADMANYNNDYKGASYPVYPLNNGQEHDSEMPAEMDSIATQMQWNKATGIFTMHGFVEAFARAGNPVNPKCIPMGYFMRPRVPVTHFLSRNFLTCDHWFSSLPAGTQANRTMALCGDSPVARTKRDLIDINKNIFDWMNSNGVRWRVYHDGFSYYTLYPKLWPHVLGDRFKRFKTFYADQLAAPSESDPEVIIIEPSYQHAPHFGSVQPNDNHAPMAVGFGEDFIRQIYLGLTANPERWANTVMVLYYDEHGGFYDHVPPPAIPYTTTESPDEEFKTLGPRVPGIIISPFVKPGSVYNETLDHTSVLQFLADKFTPGKPFSDTVQSRRNEGVHSLSDLLCPEASQNIPVAPTVQIPVQTTLGKYLPTLWPDAMEQSFTLAANAIMEKEPRAAIQTYPELVAWKDIKSKNGG